MHWQSEQYETMFDSVFEALQLARDEMVEGVLAINQTCEEQLQVLIEHQAQIVSELEQRQAERQHISQKIFISLNNKDQIQLKNKEMLRHILQRKKQIAHCKELGYEYLPNVIAEQEIQSFKTQKELAQFLILTQLNLFTGKKPSP